MSVYLIEITEDTYENKKYTDKEVEKIIKKAFKKEKIIVSYKSGRTIEELKQQDLYDSYMAAG